MGKLTRQKKKMHLEAPKPPGAPEKVPTSSFMEVASAVKPSVSTPLISSTSGNLFDGIKIDFSSLNTKLNDDDVRSVKSFKSVKSELGKSTVLSKKDKMKLRREMFLKKIDIVNQVKKQKELVKKRKNVAIIGDTNPLHDALPSLESLLKNRTDIPYKGRREASKPKGIQKATKQKKTHLQGIEMYKNILKSKQFQKDPLATVDQHVKTIIDSVKLSTNKSK